jgi:hypothetical protein
MVIRQFASNNDKILHENNLQLEIDNKDLIKYNQEINSQIIIDPITCNYYFLFSFS